MVPIGLKANSLIIIKKKKNCEYDRNINGKTCELT